MRKALIAVLFALAPIAAYAADKPLVQESGQIKQIPANTALQLNAGSTSAASINMPHGSAPTSPTNGDCWTTTSGLTCRINGVSVTYTASTPPGGSSSQVQYNNSGGFGGISGATTDGTSMTFGDGNAKFSGASSGTMILKAPSTGGGTMTAPPGTDTLVAVSATQTLTGKTLTSPVINTPTGIVKGDVGLGNVDNTSDATKNSASVTLTNHSIDGGNNTLSNIANGSLSNSTMTINGTTCTLGSPCTPPGSGAVGTTGKYVLAATAGVFMSSFGGL